MSARLYAMSISHPARAARLMLELKGVEYEAVEVSPGTQAVRMRLAGYRGGTVPALSIDGRRVVGTLAISRALEEMRPEPPLYPRDAVRRRAVEEAELWGERVLQPIPRRMLRFAVRNDPSARVWFAGFLGNPRPELMARAMGPIAAFYARREQADRLERIRADWEALPSHLDRVDELIAAGAIGGEELNAADFQIGTTLRVLLACADYAPRVEGRPAAELGRRVWPDYRYEFPPLLPRELAEAAA